MKASHTAAVQRLEEERHAADARRTARLETMPALNGETIEQYLDWLAKHAPALDERHLATCLQLAELTVRLQMGKAQAKATQHTLVQDGTIAPPPPTGG